MNTNDRKILLLTEYGLNEEIKNILKSPLNLSFNLISDFIENKLDNLKKNLDSIKKFTAGIESAEKKGKNYVIANMYPYYFAFHQYVHSSFRARQGKVLEEIIKNVVKNKKNVKILEKKEQKKLFDTKEKKLPDYDIFLQKDNKIFIVQIRSRDDTGGTTAKTSLVEGIKYIKEHYIGNIKDIEYIIFVWESLDKQQETTTKEKFFDYLKEEIKIKKEEFKSNISNNKGVSIPLNNFVNLNLYLVYEKEKFINLLSNKMKLSKSINTKLREIINDILDWDDFWMAYQYIGLEYERLKRCNFSYLHFFIEKLKEKINNINENYIETANQLALEFLRENIEMPFKNGQDNFIYFRDLILLIFIYYKKKD